MPALLLHPRDLEQNRPVYLEHFRVRFWSLYAGNRLLVPVKSVHVKMESWSLNGGLRLAQIVKVILAVNPQRGIQHKKNNTILFTQPFSYLWRHGECCLKQSCG